MTSDYKMPVLSGLKPLSNTLAAKKFFQDWGPRERKTYGLVVNYVRTIDFAIHEYRLAYEQIARFSAAERPIINAIVLAGGHLEVCITTLHRGVLLFNTLRRRNTISSEPLWSISRETRGLDEAAKKRLRAMRNSIQHIEEDIINDRISSDQSIMPYPESESFTLGEHTVAYEELVKWLGILHNIAVLLSRKA
jgi:hypothetical protein